MVEMYTIILFFLALSKIITCFSEAFFKLYHSSRKSKPPKYTKTAAVITAAENFMCLFQSVSLGCIELLESEQVLISLDALDLSFAEELLCTLGEGAGQ